MTAAILWKEYRQQRNVLVAFFLIAVLIVWALQLPIFEAGTNARAVADRQYLVYGLLVALAIFQGLLSGALLFAEEKESKTATFLDHLSPRRGALFSRKLLAGLLAVFSLSLLLMAINWFSGRDQWATTLTILGISLDALVWGILAGVLFRTSLMAALAGLGMTALSWLGWSYLVALTRDLLWSRSEEPAWSLLILWRAILTLVPLLIAWTLYCRSDAERRTSGSGVLASLWRIVPPQERALSWLILRQGRWLLLIAFPLVLIGGPLIAFFPFTAWPIATLATGIIFGLICFAPEQPDAVSFLGAQRFSSGRIWTVKVLFWFIMLALVVGLTWLIANGMNAGGHFRNEIRYSLIGLSFGNRLMLFVIWPLYGFCFGLFLGQVTRRPIIGFFLSVMLTPVVAFLWVPSLLMGGVPVWWVLTIPAILLATSRFLMRPWFSGRLMTAGGIGTMALAAVLIALSISGFFLYRTVQIPDEGEPFDIAAFNAELDAAAKQEAGPLLRSAGLSFREYQEEVEKEFFGKEAAQVPGKPWRDKPKLRVPEILSSGWPNDDEALDLWIKRIFAGEWATQAEKAARLPLGLVLDPRNFSWTSHSWNSLWPLTEMGDYFTVRALQLQASGEKTASIEAFETALALSRQVSNFGLGYPLRSSVEMQSDVFNGFDRWLQDLGPDKATLSAALAMLQKHEAAIPDPLNTIKAEYLVTRKYEPASHSTEPLQFKVLRFAFNIPWEKDRQQRLLRAATVDSLARMKRLLQGETYESINPGEEPFEFPWQLYGFSHLIGGDLVRQVATMHQDVRAFTLITAIASYQADHEKPPAALTDLVPNYLSKIPINPFDGKEFGYFICQDEKARYPANRWGGSLMLNAVKGQAVISARSRFTIWEDGPKWIQHHWAVPKWK